MSHDEKKALGKILLEQRAVAPADLERVAAAGRPGGPRLATRLIDAGLVSEIEALRALSAQRGVPGLDLHQICIKLVDLASIPRDIALVHKLLPVLERDDRVFIAMANPEEKKVIEELEFVTGKRVFAYIALEGALLRCIRDAYDARERGESHYVGPACPNEVLRRAGLDPRNYGRPDEQTAVAATPTPAVAAPAPAAAPIAPSPAPAAAAREPAPAPPVRRPPPPPPQRTNAGPARVPVAAPTPSIASAPAAPPSAAAPPVPAAPKGVFRVEPANTEQRFRPSSSSMAAVQAPVVVDKRMERVAEVQLNEADFGDVADELNIGVERGRARGPRPAPGQKKILVVDDELDIRVLIRRVLEERGHFVLEADRGRLALELVKVESPDLIVLDAMLPEVHGFDIAKRIRGSSKYGHIPIVMVSAVYRGWRFAQDAKQSYGVDAYLEKPFRVQELVEVIENALTSGRAGANAAQMSSEAERLLNEGVEAYRTNDLERATELLQKGVAIDPLAYKLRFHLGLLLGKRGMLYAAIEQLERAVQLHSTHFACLKNLAILYQQAGFRNKALEAWERALSGAPDDETRKVIKEHIVSLL